MSYDTEKPIIQLFDSRLTCKGTENSKYILLELRHDFTPFVFALSSHVVRNT